MQFLHQDFIRICTEKQLTVSDIAKEISLSPSTVQKWFDRSATPYPSCIKKLTMVLGCEEADIFAENGGTVGSEKTPVTEAPVQPVRGKTVKQSKPTTEKKIPVAEAPLSAAPDDTPSQPVKKKPETQPSCAGEKQKPAIPANTGIVQETHPAETASLSREDVMRIMKDTKFCSKAVTKNMTPEEMSEWFREYSANMVRQASDAISSMASVGQAVICGASSGNLVNARFMPLLKAAETASDEGIALAIEILKKVR